MSNEEALYEIQRTLGRFEQHLIAQDQVLAELKADVSALKAKPARQWSAVGKWVATVAATVVAAIIAVKAKALGK